MSDTNPTLDFVSMTDEELKAALAQHQIGLTLDEARKVQELLGRAPTLTEATIWGIQGSEHCSYKSTRMHLKGLPTKGTYVILGPSEDSGIIEIANINGKKYGIVMAHESHNHPSQVVPYEGAATGVGGIVRDVVCMGAKVIATADPLRFGQVDRPLTKLLAEGVVDGISGYGNPIGVPNIAGDVYFNSEYNDNCLVNVVSLGILSEDELIHSYAAKGAGEEGHVLILVGKPTDGSGFGGASFSSLELNEEDKETNKSAVQEPNPFLKKHLMSATYDLFRKLKESGQIHRVGLKDLGAGGVVCASVEMVAAAGYGAEIDLEKVHVALQGLPAHVVACSETQERFMWTVPAELADMIIEHYNVTWDLPDVARGAGASVVGKVIAEDRYSLTHKGEIVCDAKPEAITSGLLYDRPHKPKSLSQKEERLDLSNEEILDITKKILAHENVASRKPIYENYDKDVQGVTVIESGEADAGVIAPLLNRFELAPADRKVGVALSVDANPRYGLASAHRQAELAVLESMRNIAAVGATPWCITDCLNYGSPENEEQMQEIIDGIQGIKLALESVPLKAKPDEAVPCVSGNVSLYNFSKNRSIPPSAIIGMLGRIENYEKAIKMDMKPRPSHLYMLGNRTAEMGASIAFDVLGKSISAGKLPEPRYEQTKNEIYAVIDAIDAETVLACHDISDGGLLTAILEMFFAGREKHPNAKLGSSVNLPVDQIGFSLAEILFSENGGFVCQVDYNHSESFESIIKQHNVIPHYLGEIVSDSESLTINGIEFNIPEMHHLHENGLREKLK